MSSHMYGNPPEQPAFHAYQEQPYSQTYTKYAPVSNQPYSNEQVSVHPNSYADQHESSAVPPVDVISTASEKPGTIKPTLEAHNSLTASTPSNSTVSRKTHLLSQRNDFLLDWALKILGVASAILFGIWAPISYKITADGNADNDAAQASLMYEISSMRKEAATAASAQRSAVSAQQSVVSALAKVQNQLENMGLVWAWEFCSGRTNGVCTDLTSSAPLSRALSSLGGLTDSASMSPPMSSSPPRTSTAGASSSTIPEGPHKGGESSKDLLAIILGSVFGAIVVIGFVVGILVKKRQQKRLVAESQG